EFISEEDAIEGIDHLFRNAIKLQFDKDREYGYKHLVALSGGLDTRMTTWVAHEMGYTDQLNYTFSQSDYLDATIPKQIAADLRHEWLFKALDNGLFLREIDAINSITGGHLPYFGLGHGYSLFKYLNFDDFGIGHSGLFGEAIIGSVFKKVSDIYNKKIRGECSTKLINNVLSDSFERSYKNHEVFLFYQKGFNGVNSGSLGIQEYTETLSPFINLELFNYCMKLPLELMLNHNLYKKWVVRKYPEAADYRWAHINAKITDARIKVKGKEIPLRNLLPKILSKMKPVKASIETRRHMNPLDYWYNTNPDIKHFQDIYFLDNIDRISSSNKIKTDCKELYHHGNAIEKNMVLTLLSALKLFF
ncbi:MAG: asparagine synthase, partial [Bacteroidia bacterium]|nr:asparagine synthase [Bacteroidia bacterium]